MKTVIPYGVGGNGVQSIKTSTKFAKNTWHGPMRSKLLNQFLGDVERGAPVINDATKEDAYYIGMEEVADIIDNGDNAPGTLLKYCSAELKDNFNNADLIIAKGQGNYETLDNENKLIYFLLQAKCPLIARNLGVELGDLVLMRNNVHI